MHRNFVIDQGKIVISEELIKKHCFICDDLYFKNNNTLSQFDDTLLISESEELICYEDPSKALPTKFYNEFGEEVTISKSFFGKGATGFVYDNKFYFVDQIKAVD